MDDKRPVDVALDLLVYLPVGLAVSARQLLPALARQGRERLGTQLTQARVVGQFSVEQGRLRASTAFNRARAQGVERLERLSGSEPVLPPPPQPARPTSGATRRATRGPAGAELAIPGYDSLAASQVLPRLEGLAPDELEAVRAYEAAHRGRKTILGRIDQLQGA